MTKADVKWCMAWMNMSYDEAVDYIHKKNDKSIPNSIPSMKTSSHNISNSKRMRQRS